MMIDRYRPNAYATSLPKVPPASIALWIGLLVTLILWPTPAVAGSPPAEWQPFGHLLDYIPQDARQDPLVEFTLKDTGIDATLSQENRLFISQNEILLNTMRVELNSDQLNWRLKEARKRLMIVPENQPAYAALFERYCRAVVDYILQRTGLPNPYRAIVTLQDTRSASIRPDDEGITAYLVHNIADVYSEQYEFYTGLNTDRKISINLDNRVYLGEIGSYSSFLVVDENQQISFERNAYTLWRNSAENPVNVLVAPIEETLHIALRGATEEAIKSHLTGQSPITRADREAIVEEWLAIEEAVVSGLVNMLLPEIIDRFLEGHSRGDIQAALSERNALDRYRLLDQGMAVVNVLGLQSAIGLYLGQPADFKALLTPPAGELAAPPEDDTAEASINHPSA